LPDIINHRSFGRVAGSVSLGFVFDEVGYLSAE
jgi:hypothetical protein